MGTSYDMMHVKGHIDECTLTLVRRPRLGDTAPTICEQGAGSA